MKRTTLYLPESLDVTLAEIAEQEGTPRGELIRAILRDHVLGWRKRTLEKGSVGRPRQSADEKAFKDHIQFVDEMYRRLRELKGDEFFAVMLQGQYDVYRTAVDLRDYGTVAWFFSACPWQVPNEFEQLYKERNGRTRTEDESSHDAQEG